jgi:hypothetical protein
MHAPTIRPRSAIEIVDAAVSLFRDNFKTMAVIGLAATLPFAAAAVIVGLGMAGQATINPAAFIAHPEVFLPWMVGFGLLMLFWMAVVDGAMTFAAAEAYHGRSPSPADAFRGAMNRGMSLVGGNLLRMLIVGGMVGVAAGAVALAAQANGFIAAIIGIGVFVLLLHLLARTFAITSAIVIEDRSASEGVQRSFFLSKDATLRIVGIAFLCITIYSAVQMIGSMVIQMIITLVLRSPVIALVTANLATMMVYPFLNIAIMVLYYDQRVRKEGYDLDVMTHAMPVPSMPPG